jgi:hypothetical protein
MYCGERLRTEGEDSFGRVAKSLGVVKEHIQITRLMAEHSEHQRHLTAMVRRMISSMLHQI